MRRALHFALALLAVPFWTVSVTAFVVFAGIAVAAHAVLPQSRYGNCWMYAVPRWVLHDGYLTIRKAEDVRFLKIFPIPHALWLRKTPVARTIKQFIPLNRVHDQWLPLATIYFRGRVVSTDTPHDVTGGTTS